MPIYQRTRPITVFLIFCLVMLAGCTSTDNPEALRSFDEKVNKGQYEAAVTEGKAYLAAHPESYRGWGLMGWAHFKQDQFEEAEKCFKKSLEINEKWDNAYVGLGAMARQRGELDKASEYYLKSIEIEPDNAQAYASLVVVAILREDYAKATEYGTKAWELDSENAIVAANLSAAHHYSGNIEERDKFYKHAERLGYINLKSLDRIFAE